MSSLQETMVIDQVGKKDDAIIPPPMKKKRTMKEKKEQDGEAFARKIRLFPTTEQKQKLKQATGTARWIYNRCLFMCLEASKAGLKLPDIKQLRAHIVSNGNFAHENQWALQTPYEIRDQAAIELLNAYKSNFAKRRLNPFHTFDLRFRKKRANYGAIKVVAKHWNNQTFYPKIWGFGPLRSAEPIPDKLPADTSITLENGNYYLIVVDRKPRSTTPETARNRICSIGNLFNFIWSFVSYQHNELININRSWCSMFCHHL